MQIRDGFVSNSSSSSFVLVVEKSVAEKLLKELSPQEKQIVTSMQEEKTFLGKDVYTYKTWSDAGGYSNWTSFEEENPKLAEWIAEDDDARDPFEIFYKFSEAAEKAGALSISDGNG